MPRTVNRVVQRPCKSAVELIKNGKGQVMLRPLKAIMDKETNVFFKDPESRNV